MNLSGVDLARERALFHLRDYAAKFKGGEIPIPIPVEQIAEVSFGFEIDRRELEQEISGMLFAADKRIVLNSRRSSTNQRFTIGHELGHFCLHVAAGGTEQCPVGMPSERERQANHFAATLLLPTNLVLIELADEMNAAERIAKDEGRIYEVTGHELDLMTERLAKRFWVSKKAMEILLSRRFKIQRPAQMSLELGIEVA
jgi:Zn-dependent peptidase ImmA (M78 family)